MEGRDTSLLQVLRAGLGGVEVELIQGTVISASPLKIQATNDEKLIITDRITVVPQHLTTHTVSVSIAGSTGSADGHSHGLGGTRSLTIYNALQKGDTVLLLALNKGKLYYVLDKVVS